MSRRAPAAASGFLAGLIAGEALFVSGLFRYGGDLFAWAPQPGAVAWVVLRSIALYGLLGAAAGLVLGLGLAGAGRLLGRPKASPAIPVFGLVLGLLLAAVVFAELTAWWQVEVLAGLPWDDPERLPAVARHAFYALLAGGAAGFGLGRLERLSAAAGARRLALGSGAGLLALLAAASWALGLGAPARAGEPERVVLVGLDGLTLRVLSPLLERGELPTFERLVREGAWGTLLTYGTAASPQVWTTIATGKKVRDHGIDDFVTVREASYRAEPMKSFDWRARPLWDVAGGLGRRVGVVNWLMTHPPREVAGYLVSRLDVEARGRTFPPGLDAELRRLPPPRNPGQPAELRRALDSLDRTFAAAHHLLAKEPLDLLALYNHTSDGVQHAHWRHYQPSAFDRDLWQLETSEVARLEEVVPETYRRIDRRLGELMAAVGEDALVAVISDHGQKAAERPAVRFHLDRLLAELGFAQLGADGRRADYARSRAYTRVETPWTPYLRISLNLAGREPQGVVDPSAAPALLADLAGALEAVRFEGGERLFGEVATAGELEAAGRPSRGADLVVAHSRFTRDPRFLERRVLVGERRVPLAELAEVDVEVSGAHDHQGVLFLSGPGVRRGPLGQRATTTALQVLVRHLTDKLDAVDLLLAPMRRLGLLERASTLDLAPTLLYALGLPAARDMSGRPAVELFAFGRESRWVDTYEGLELEQPEETESLSDEELMEQLRALGYVN